MLGRLVLIALQLAIAWFGAPYVLRYIPPLGGDVQVFIQAVIFAVIVWVVGLIGSHVIKEVSVPSSSTLVWAIVGGLIGAALVVLKVPASIPLSFPPLLLPLALAIIGYAVKK
jgi:hypothetical protein